MDQLQSALVASVLKETLDELTIANRGRKVSCPNLIRGPINNRFQNKMHKSVCQELDPFKLAIQSLNEIKLQKDINFLETFVSKTIEDLISSNSFNHLEKILRMENLRTQEETQLLVDHECNLVSMKGAKKKLTKKLTKSEMRLRMADEIFADVKNDLKNVKQLNEMEMSLVQKWEQTRFDQAQISIEKEERELKKQTEKFTCKTANEQRTIYDVENYIELQIKQFETQIEFWKQKYTTELNDLNEKIKTTSNSIMKLTKKHERHSDISENRQQSIDDYREQKARERREYEIQQNRIQAAIRIEAWWRGVMVRRHLGPYRRKKKGKKGGKKGK